MNPENTPNPLTLQIALNQIQEYCCELKSMMQKMETKLRGDIIEQGGVKNINYYYYPTKDADVTTVGDIPTHLQESKGQALMQNLAKAGMIDDEWQPVNLSGSERALLAKAVCDRLQIYDVWQVFGQLWGSNPNTLRSAYNKAMEQKKTLVFLESNKGDGSLWLF